MITYGSAGTEDVEKIYRLCKGLIEDYEALDCVDVDLVLKWVYRKIETSIDEYTTVYTDGQKAGYYHFYQNEDGEYEIDDLYIFPAYQNRGIGSQIIQRCCAAVDQPIMLYVFIRNDRAVALYKRLGFEIVQTVNDTRYIMKWVKRKYYEAYEERYRTAHARGVSWESDTSTPIVMEMIRKYQISPRQRLLEIGCGEGRDSRSVLEQGYSLLATDISQEAIAYCKKKTPQYADHFCVLDCLSDHLDEQYDFIFGIAVVHMLVLDEDRNGFFQFIRTHLSAEGSALICSMGDGMLEHRSDIETAFTLQERNHVSGEMMVAGTSCRMVSWDTLEKEIAKNGLKLIEKGMTSAPPAFDRLMYAVVKK